jgi:hypothetical protein
MQLLRGEKDMKNILIIILTLGLCLSIQAQTMQPLYIRFDGETVNSNLQKMENLYFNYENDSLDEDIFKFWRINCAGVSLRVATINKRNYIEITHAQLADYNVKTDEEVRTMLVAMGYEQNVKFFEDLERENKLCVVEILPNNKARIYQVRNITRR